MSRVKTIGLLLVLLPVTATAIDLAQTPVESEFAAQVRSEGPFLLAAATDDEWTVDESDKPADSVPTAGGSGRKSVAKAALLSALVPGLGQMYNDRDVKARYFFGAEAVTWLAFGAFRLYGGWKEDDLIAFGNEHASAQLDGKSDEFLDWVGFYTDIDDFNAAGRVGDPDRAYLFDTPENHWHWDSAENQDEFRNLKNSSREAYRRSDFMLWVAALNRVVSVIDAVIDARRINQETGERWELGGVEYDIDVNPMSDTRQITLTVYPGL